VGKEGKRKAGGKEGEEKKDKNDNKYIKNTYYFLHTNEPKVQQHHFP
jgi:hypothetical protein